MMQQLLVIPIALLSIFLSIPVYAASTRNLRIAFNGEPGNTLVVSIAENVLEHDLGYSVKLVDVPNGVEWKGVADRSLDAMLVAWLPTTQAAYWKKFKNQVLDLGVMFEGKIGLVIPAYIPEDELNSIGDLNSPAVQKKVKATIVGIEPGAGIMQRTEMAIKKYGLAGYKLVNSSTPAMVGALAAAEKEHMWIVITGWSPLFIFSKWKLRYLQDPKGVFGVTQQIHAIGREDLKEYAPRAANFLSHYKLPAQLLNAAMLEYNSNNSVDKTVDDFIATHGSLVKAWIRYAKTQPKWGVAN